MNKQLKKQVYEVYNGPRENLAYRSHEFVSRKHAYAIMKHALPRGYNAFQADLILEHFSDDTMFDIARESSVCMYVKGNDLPSKTDLQADEYDAQVDGTIRIWWD